MDNLKLRFADRDNTELPLAMGVHGIGRIGDGERLGPVPESQSPAVRFCIDRRGVWLTVAEGVRGVHVNGRQIQRMAMLRVGDAIYVDGIGMRLVSTRAVAAPPPEWQRDDDGEGDPRVVLRGVGGQYHGRSFTLERPRLVGRVHDADIRIDEPAFADRHARLEMQGGQVVLRDLGSAEGSEVNGEQVRDAVLEPGDQIVFDAHHRFVVEAPSRATVRDSVPDDSAQAAAAAAAPVATQATAKASIRRLPWLLLAALLLAALLGALLLFGAG
jgi:hypothetical protein